MKYVPWKSALIAGAITLQTMIAVANPGAELPPAEAAAQGVALLNAFKNKEAIPFLERAYAASPTNAAVLTRLTEAYCNAGEDLDNAESEAYYKKAVAYADTLKTLAPDKAETYFHICVAYGDLALFKDGKEKVTLSRNIEAMARKGIELDPTYSRPYSVLGVYYREIASLNPVLRTFAKYLLGGLPDGTLADSERMFLKSIELEAGNVYGHYQLAVTYEKMGKPDQAAAMYRKVLALPMVDHQDAKWRRLSTERLKALQRS
jgi:tetratricopeptide (TPR) repeat protein